MSQAFTKSMARNIFFGGTVFFFLLLVALTVDTMQVLPKRDHRENLTPAVARGKHVWERNDCIGCHTLLGEGAYFAPELGNVYQRRGGEFIKVWMQAMPTKAPGRRQMPNFNFSDAQLDDLVEFLKWTNGVDTEKWPPNIEG